MSLLTILWEIISNIPAIFNLVKEIIALIGMLGSPSAKAQAYKNLSAAYQDFRQTGNPAQLNALHSQLAAVANAPDTVGNT
jgi:hypothetical protein